MFSDHYGQIVPSLSFLDGFIATTPPPIFFHTVMWNKFLEPIENGQVGSLPLRRCVLKICKPISIEDIIRGWTTATCVAFIDGVYNLAGLRMVLQAFLVQVWAQE